MSLYYRKISSLSKYEKILSNLKNKNEIISIILTNSEKFIQKNNVKQ